MKRSTLHFMWDNILIAKQKYKFRNTNLQEINKLSKSAKSGTSSTLGRLRSYSNPGQRFILTSQSESALGLNFQSSTKFYMKSMFVFNENDCFVHRVQRSVSAKWEGIFAN